LAGERRRQRTPVEERGRRDAARRDREPEPGVKRVAWVVLGIVAFYTLRCAILPRLLPPGDVEYRGETIRLTKWYFSYDDYKDDPESIAPAERVRVERLVASAPIGRIFNGRMEMIRAVSDIRFPGFGMSQFGEKSQSDGSVLAGYSVEIPLAEKDRCLVFRGRSGIYTRIDDFVVPAEPAIRAVRQDRDQLVYTTHDGREVLRHAIARDE
jgi:hypothetical protein